MGQPPFLLPRFGKAPPTFRTRGRSRSVALPPLELYTRPQGMASFHDNLRETHSVLEPVVAASSAFCSIPALFLPEANLAPRRAASNPACFKSIPVAVFCTLRLPPRGQMYGMVGLRAASSPRYVARRCSETTNQCCSCKYSDWNLQKEKYIQNSGNVPSGDTAAQVTEHQRRRTDKHVMGSDLRAQKKEWPLSDPTHRSSRLRTTRATKGFGLSFLRNQLSLWSRCSSSKHFHSRSYFHRQQSPSFLCTADE